MAKKLFFLIVLFFFVGCTFAQNTQNSDAKYEALFVYNFTRYFEYPENNGETFVIGVFKDPALYFQLKKFAGKLVEQKKIEVQYLENSKEISSQQMICIGHHLQVNVKTQVISACTGKPIIIIGDKKTLKLGAHIGFFIQEDIIKFALVPTEKFPQNIKVSGKVKELASK